jgi:hypothetical protein
MQINFQYCNTALPMSLSCLYDDTANTVHVEYCMVKYDTNE